MGSFHRGGAPQPQKFKILKWKVTHFRSVAVYMSDPRPPYNDLHAQALQVPGRVRVARARPAQSLVLGWGSPTEPYILLYTLNRVHLPHPKKKRRARARAGPLACVGVSFRPQVGAKTDLERICVRLQISGSLSTQGRAGFEDSAVFRGWVCGHRSQRAKSAANVVH